MPTYPFGEYISNYLNTYLLDFLGSNNHPKIRAVDFDKHIDLICYE